MSSVKLLVVTVHIFVYKYLFTIVFFGKRKKLLTKPFTFSKWKNISKKNQILKMKVHSETHFEKNSNSIKKGSGMFVGTKFDVPYTYFNRRGEGRFYPNFAEVAQNISPWLHLWEYMCVISRKRLDFEKTKPAPRCWDLNKIFTPDPKDPRFMFPFFMFSY